MKTVSFLAATLIILAGSVSANAQGYGSRYDNTRSQRLDTNRSRSTFGNSTFGTRRDSARPAYGPNDRSTLGDPQPRIYGTKPTLGNPSGIRTTSPKRCTGLLCN